MGGRLQARSSKKRSPITTADPEQQPSSEGGVRRRAATSEAAAAAGTGTGTQSGQDGQLSEKLQHSTIQIDDHDSKQPSGSSTHPKDSSVVFDTKEHTPDEHEHDEHHRTWTERMHGHRPDRHLFPYRSAKENYRAARTFLRRFFFLLLIIPAWVLPNVMMKRAEHELEASHGATAPSNGTISGAHGGNFTTTSPFVSFSGAEGGGHGPEVSKGVNIATFILNMFVMMHLGKAAGAALEELVPKFGMVSKHLLFF
jgi:hypothetical protein